MQGQIMNVAECSLSWATIDQFDKKLENLVTPFELTVELEIETTKMIYDIVNQAGDEGDWATFNWLNGHSKDSGMLVNEQVVFCLIV